jgi:hypothetical protein
MKSKSMAFILFIVVMILSACSPAAGPTEEPPAPVIDASSHEFLQIDDVQVSVGVGSPIPVHVNVSGYVLDTCSQVEFTSIKQDGSNFIIELSTLATSSKDCVKDFLPFRMSIPLNTIDLPAGEYSVEVNGSRVTFDLEKGDSSDPAPVMSSTAQDVMVDSVNIEMGVGSPIPVHAVVSLNLPSSCAQLRDIRLQREGTTFDVRLIADVPERADCQADNIPFQLEIPLNIVNLPEGLYVVNVNGVSASFDPRAVPASQ